MASDTAATRPLQRKVATILSADVAGYSRLMADDEERTLMVFRDHKQVFEDLIAQHDGRIFNTAGDAILAEFASAVEAVRCATEIQAALRTRNDQLPPARRVEFRIGVNLGDVMVHGTDLLGDGVNVAARLQAAAEPGGVCISGSVYDQIRNKLMSLTFRSLGEQNYKNIPQPVQDDFSIAGTGAAGRAAGPRDRGAARLRRPVVAVRWCWRVGGGGLVGVRAASAGSGGGGAAAGCRRCGLPPPTRGYRHGRAMATGPSVRRWPPTTRRAVSMHRQPCMTEKSSASGRAERRASPWCCRARLPPMARRKSCCAAKARMATGASRSTWRGC